MGLYVQGLDQLVVKWGRERSIFHKVISVIALHKKAGVPFYA